MRTDIENLKSLGSKARDIADYDPAILETFANVNPARDYWVSLTATEFTTLCPKTGQPDFAELTIRYIPDERLVESKSLKLYLFSFRNHGNFHEDTVNTIFRDLWNLMEPKYLEVIGKFAPRGGISIDPFVNGGKDDAHKRLAEERFSRWQGAR